MDPKVYTVASLTGEDDEHPSLHAGYNDALVIDVDPGTLVGRTDGERGPAESVAIGLVPTYEDLDSFPPNPAPPVGYTCVGFDLFTKALYIWDTGTSAWIEVGPAA